MNKAEKRVIKRVVELYNQYKKYDAIRAIRDFCIFSDNMELKKEIDNIVGFNTLKEFPKDLGEER